MWVVATALAISGLVGIWRIARAEARAYADAPVAKEADDEDSVSFGQFNVLVRIMGRNVRERPVAARNDFLMLGGAILLGLLADVLSLTL